MEGLICSSIPHSQPHSLGARGLLGIILGICLICFSDGVFRYIVAVGRVFAFLVLGGRPADNPVCPPHPDLVPYVSHHSSTSLHGYSGSAPCLCWACPSGLALASIQGLSPQFLRPWTLPASSVRGRGIGLRSGGLGLGCLLQASSLGPPSKCQGWST